MTQTPEQAAPSSIERIADPIGQAFKSLESRREYMRNLRIEIPALESAWSSVERNVLTLGRRRRAIEAPLTPLPEPRGATATQNWLEQRRAQGSRAKDWIERLPAALALLRSVEAVEGFGRTYLLPDADEQRAEALRGEMRQAIIRQDLSSMDALLSQIQASLIHDGQRRTDLTRIVGSRMAEALPVLEALALQDATSVPELQRWQADVRTSAAAILDALSRWDVLAARQAEARLNALADSVPEIRQRIFDELRLAEALISTGELAQRERTLRREELEGTSGFRHAAPVMAVLGVVGAFVGLGVIALAVFAPELTIRWFGSVALAMTTAFITLGAGTAAMVGARRLSTRRLSAAEAADSIDRELAKGARELADLKGRAETMRKALGWFRI
jgi:hypothetical protein